MKRIIIGLAGEKDAGKTTAAKVLSDMGFYYVSINDKVLELANYLCTEKISQKHLDDIRNKGYNVSRLYWINLIMSSLPEDKRRIVIDDMREEDDIQQVIIPFYITRDSGTHAIKGFKTVRNLSNLDSFKKLIKEMFENFAK